MNDRRFARPSLESAGLSAAQKPAAAGPPPAAIDLPPETGPVIAERLEDRSGAAPQHPITERIHARNRGTQRGGGTDRIRSSHSPEDLDVGLVGAAPAVPSAPSEGSAVVAPPPPGAPPPPDLEASTAVVSDDGFLTTPPAGLTTGPVEKTAGHAKPPASNAAAFRPPRLATPAKPAPPSPGIAELLSPEGEDEIELVSVSTDDTTDRIHSVRVEKPTPSGSLPVARKLPTKVPLFDDLSQAAFVALVKQLSYRTFESGQQILREGEPGRSFFVIVEGRVRIWKQLDDGKDVVLAYLDEGAFFGEMALLSGAPRTANVSAGRTRSCSS
jgi:hypothetical protein